MAARRVVKTAVDWVAFAERVPGQQKEAFRAMKTKSDQFANRVHKYPETLPKIDWEFYRSRITVPGLVDKFEKAYASVSVPYPQDKENILAKVSEQEKGAMAEVAEYKKNVESDVKDCRDLIAALNKLPKPEEMTMEMYTDYFPDHALNPLKPSMWPHDKQSQPQNDPNFIN